MLGMKSTVRISTRLACVVATWWFTSAMALAEEGYNAPKLDGEFPWRAIGATSICVAGLLLVGLKNARRSQQNTK